MNILERMQIQIEEWEGANDPRGIFLACYWMMTGNMLKGIAEGRFHDRDWVTTLLHRFADYYFDALVCYDCEEEREVFRQELERRVLKRARQMALDFLKMPS